MKKAVSLQMLLILILLCGCNGNKENTDTRFVLDTVATLTADCDKDTLDGAFDLCADFERLLSRTVAGSDVYKLNESEQFIKVSADTRKIIERSLYYSELTNGRFDITICPVSMLWDFKNSVVPGRDEIAEALRSVDYQSIEINNDEINLNGKKIDLGGIAKGYIADKVKDYFINKGVKRGIINLGGNIVVFGDDYDVGIQNPSGEGIIATMRMKNKTAVTSGIYQRYIEEDGKIYHHIIDPSTGYGVENELASVTVIGDSSLDCDALSTVCMLMGTSEGIKIINDIENTEAVFISRKGEITLTSGLYREGKRILDK